MSRQYEKTTIKIVDDLTGKVFGRLTVVSLLGRFNKKNYWLCSCSCGGSAEVYTGALKIGNTKSCGCVNSERLKARNKTHGLSNHPMYGMWHRMLQRCNDKGCNDYKYYGARGIAVHESWHDFPTFLRDMGERPEGGTLERVDNNKGYEPGNVKWATRLEQMKNTRSVKEVTYNGETHCISEWERKLGFKQGTLKARLGMLGYTVEEAMTKPVKCGGLLPNKRYAHLEDQSWRNTTAMRKKPQQPRLSHEQVERMRRLHDNVAMSYTLLAKLFGVSIETASNAVQGLKAYEEMLNAA